MLKIPRLVGEASAAPLAGDDKALELTVSCQLSICRAYAKSSQLSGSSLRVGDVGRLEVGDCVKSA